MYSWMPNISATQNVEFSQKESQMCSCKYAPKYAPKCALWMRAKMLGHNAHQWRIRSIALVSGQKQEQLNRGSGWIPNAPSDNTSTLSSANIPSCMIVCAMHYNQTVQTVWVYTFAKSTWVWCKNTWRLVLHHVSKAQQSGWCRLTSLHLCSVCKYIVDLLLYIIRSVWGLGFHVWLSA